ncbi:ribosomal protein [Lophium mytilinum]|uniref:Large ribosomal subunit protein mL46 n=1 Tax=Lophium mytilinum TaxID=390894 RepID=A0A6A6R2A7_9PEZI|nr:ribosomal protein [Lophium mytilinum]
MNAGHRSARHIASRKGPSICHARISPYSSAATATAPAPETQAQLSSIPPVTSTSLAQSYQVRAGVVLSRPPLLTRDLHPFEKSFFLYQRRLNERLALPFPRYFYFKKDTPADIDWKRKMKQRLTPARDIGVYNPYGPEGWNDEVLVGAKEAEPAWQVERLLEDADASAPESTGADAAKGMEGAAVAEAGVEIAAEASKKKAEPIERPMPRETEADRKGDQRSLDRLMQRSLYLVVQNKEGRWVLPDDQIQGRETLHQAAERVLVHNGGLNMNTWVVGNVPVGHYSFDYVKRRPHPERANVEALGEKIFFMKARIMAGQASLEDNKLGIKDFKWLTKEEVQKVVNQKYWSAIQNMLTDR